MEIIEAQRDIARSHVGGGPGAFVSGLAWLMAGIIEARHGASLGFTTLFFGGWFIFPVSALICRTLFRREAETPGNMLGRTALESTIAMIGGFLAAWLFLDLQPDFVFPLAALAVGTHYFAFRTVYGDPIFWLLGGLIALAAAAALFAPAKLPLNILFTVALIELAFGLILTARAPRAR